MALTTPTIPLATGIKVMTVVIQSNANYPTAKLLPFAGDSNFWLNNFEFYVRQLGSGVFNSNVTVLQGGAYATGTATLASTIATNTIVIGGVTLTATNGTPTAAQFKVGASDTITAANLATTINANTSLNKVVQASSSGAVVTIMCLIPGTIGNLVTLSQTGGTITVGSALTGGTDGTKGVVSHGL